MHSPPSRSPPSSSTPWPSFSLASIIQYVVLGAIAYIFAGAPLLSIVNGPGASYSGGSYSTAGSSSGRETTKLENLVIPERNLSCEEHAYRGVHVLSREPLVVYIEGFVGDGEADDVVKVSEPHFTPSTVWNAGSESLDTTIRHSEKTLTPRNQVVKCIEERARKFQGWRPHVFIEKLWTQRYGVGGHYTYHYDWSTATRTSGRVSSFMVYLEANCTGGGTHFPRLEKPLGEEWCKFIECDARTAYNLSSQVDGNGAQGSAKEMDLNEGVVFKPIKGNAVFWENMRSDGSGYPESWHAGLPVKSGVKIGLNVWSWYQHGYIPPAESSSKDHD